VHLAGAYLQVDPSRARVGPKVFTSPEIEIAVDIGVVTASFPWTALAVSLLHTLHSFHIVVKLRKC
jgi:hypothetical protein